eukprot:352179-Chlamydomonas_euryale.AAC.4
MVWDASSSAVQAGWVGTQGRMGTQTEPFKKKVRPGKVGPAQSGKVRPGKARHGKVRPGKVNAWQAGS